MHGQYQMMWPSTENSAIEIETKKERRKKCWSFRYATAVWLEKNVLSKLFNLNALYFAFFNLFWRFPLLSSREREFFSCSSICFYRIVYNNFPLRRKQHEIPTNFRGKCAISYIQVVNSSQMFHSLRKTIVLLERDRILCVCVFFLCFTQFFKTSMCSFFNAE